MKTLNDFISALLDLEVPKATIRAMAIKADYPEDEVDAELPKKARVCFLNSYLDFLAEEVRTEEEATAFINGTGDFEATTDNVKKYAKTHLNTWDLARRIWEAKAETE